MSLHDFIRDMPKVELHVHLQGATRPETLLKLAAQNDVQLPANTVEELREWYIFSDFAHFADIYDTICECFRGEADIELATREFIEGQAAQNIRYTEVTYTPNRRMPFEQQLAAINRARAWGERALNTRIGVVIDIPRDDVRGEQALMLADWAISGFGNGVVAFGLGGPEIGYPPEDYAEAFQRAINAGMPSVPHAGETVGAPSIWGALNSLKADRIGHGVLCLEDPSLVETLRQRQIPLEVCPTSNLCLGVVERIEDHPLPRLIEAGLYVTINSDDPPMFNTTLTHEYQLVAQTFGYDAARMEQFVLDALRVCFLPEADKVQLEAEFKTTFAELRQAHLG